LESGDLGPSCLEGGVTAKDRIELVEAVGQFGPFDLKYLHIWHGATLVVVHDHRVPVRGDVVGRFDPVRVALRLAGSSIRRAIRGLAFDDYERFIVGE
jgi:hypothetical protein